MAIVTKQSTGTYALAGIAASYFAERIEEALTSETVISGHTKRDVIYANK